MAHKSRSRALKRTPPGEKSGTSGPAGPSGPSSDPIGPGAPEETKIPSAKNHLFWSVSQFVRHTPELYESIAYDEMEERVVLTKPVERLDLHSSSQPVYPIPWMDDHGHSLHEWFEGRLGVNLPPQYGNRAITMNARKRRSFHPLREWAENLPGWDGTPRLDSWLVRSCGSPDTEYVRTVGRKWLISAMERAIRPGCQADYMLVLEGDQGLRKSSVLRVLGGEWFRDNVGNFASKDFLMIMARAWIIEISELSALGEHKIEFLKGFLTLREDDYRIPYQTYPIHKPRHCVFAGTTNRDDYLKDETGNRRFWPVRCDGPVDLDWLAENREKLFSEALAMLHSGELTFLNERMEALANAEQAERMYLPGWADDLKDWLDSTKPLIIKPKEVIEQTCALIGLSNDEKTQKEVGVVLRSFGWKRGQKRIEGVICKGFLSPENGPKGVKDEVHVGTDGVQEN